MPTRSNTGARSENGCNRFTLDGDDHIAEPAGFIDTDQASLRRGASRRDGLRHDAPNAVLMGDLLGQRHEADAGSLTRPSRMSSGTMRFTELVSLGDDVIVGGDMAGAVPHET